MEPAHHEGSPVQKVFVRAAPPEPEENGINTNANHQQRQYFPTSYEQKRTQYEQQVFEKY
jgi:hypothetical protein